MNEHIGSKRTGDQTGEPGSGAPGTGVNRLPLRAHGHMQLTDRDEEIIVWVARHGFVTVDQITAKFFPTPHGKSACFQRVRKLCEASPPLLERVRTHYQEPSVLRVTTHGARMADVGLAPAHVVPAEVPHALGIVDLTEAILAAHPDATLITERERRAERYRDKRKGLRKTTGRIPDAVFTLPAKGNRKEQSIAVELDRTARSKMDAEAVIRAYLSERYDQVWWYVRPSRVASLTEIVKRGRVADLFEVRPWQGR